MKSTEKIKGWLIKITETVNKCFAIHVRCLKRLGKPKLATQMGKKHPIINMRINECWLYCFYPRLLDRKWPYLSPEAPCIIWFDSMMVLSWKKMKYFAASCISLQNIMENTYKINIFCNFNSKLRLPRCA